MGALPIELFVGQHGLSARRSKMDRTSVGMNRDRIDRRGLERENDWELAVGGITLSAS
jgi:hypothetical protein